MQRPESLWYARVEAVAQADIGYDPDWATPVAVWVDLVLSNVHPQVRSGLFNNKLNRHGLREKSLH